MNKVASALFSCLCFLLPACSPLCGRTAVVSYDDLGPPALVRAALGERGPDPIIIIVMGGTNTNATPKILNAHQAINLLRANAKKLHRTPENEPLRQRMRVAYNRIYHLYRTRRDAMLAMPPFFGRGSMSMKRMMMIPPIPPEL